MNSTYQVRTSILISSKPSQASQEDLQLQQVQQIEAQLRKFYKSRIQSDIDFEQQWVEDTQDETSI